MIQYILRRLLVALPILFGVSLFTFGLVRWIPGDPILIMLGTDAMGADVEGIRRLYGLDRPWPVQYVEWLAGVLQGDLGLSIRTRLPVGQSILQRLPVTIELTALSLLLGLLIGVPAAVLAATYRGKTADALVGVVSLLGISVPGFWLAILLMLFFSLYLRLLPSIGYVALHEGPLDNLRHLILPALGLALPLGATIMRFMRSSLLEVFGQDYFRTARAKGLTYVMAVNKHALRNALIPVVTVIGIQIGRLLGGAVIIEQIFALPGLGRLVFDGIAMRDYPVVQGTVLVFTALFILINLLVDLLYGVIDPRVRLATK
ncbi:MAG: ABC transporter permease [Chloroflexi bacterium]|nr:ABC transporter permease [Chloroflexota bacterium]